MRGYLGCDEERLGPLPTDLPDRKEAFDMADEKAFGGKATPFHGPNLWPREEDLAAALFKDPVQQ